jgi:hypothetical protein
MNYAIFFKSVMNDNRQWGTSKRFFLFKDINVLFNSLTKLFFESVFRSTIAIQNKLQNHAN